LKTVVVEAARIGDYTNVNDEALVRVIRAEPLAAPKTATTNAAAITATA